MGQREMRTALPVEVQSRPQSSVASELKRVPFASRGKCPTYLAFDS